MGQRNLGRSHGTLLTCQLAVTDPIGDSLRSPRMVSAAEEDAHNDPGGRPLSALAKRPQTPGEGDILTGGIANSLTLASAPEHRI